MPMQLAPEQVKLIFGFTLPTVKNEHQITARVIRAIPGGHADYRPDPVSRSASELAAHIAGSEIMFLKGIIEGRFQHGSSLNAIDGAGIADWYDSQFDELLPKLQGLSAEELSRTLALGEAFNFPAFAYLTFAVNHSIHHRGQLSTYLRPMGGKVPSIYGKSYDDSHE